MNNTNNNIIINSSSSLPLHGRTHPTLSAHWSDMMVICAPLSTKACRGWLFTSIATYSICCEGPSPPVIYLGFSKVFFGFFWGGFLGFFWGIFLVFF